MTTKKFAEIHNEVGVTPLTQSINFGYPSKAMGRLLGVKPIPFIAVYHNEKTVLYTDVDYWVSTGKTIVEKAKTNIGFFRFLLKESEKMEEETIKIIHSLGHFKKLNYTNQELISLIKKLSHNGFMLTVYSQPGAVADHFHNSFTDLLVNIINNNNILSKKKLNPNDVFNLLTAPNLKMPSEVAKEELLKIKDVNQYLDKWFWLNYGHLGPGLKRIDVLQEIRGGIKLQDKLKLAVEQKDLTGKIFLKPEEKKLFEVARIFIYLKGMRMEICNGIFSFLNQVARKIAKETKINKKNLMYLSIPEVIEYLKTGKIPKESVLKQRRNYSVWILDDYCHGRILAGDQGRKFIRGNTISEELNLETGDEIKGNIAYGGKVKGIVKIVNSTKDMKKIKNGDVMVSIQTMPELLPAMKKAAAFVTDMGGITSHAAIVSREMKTPCIVRTRIATKILKDGDLVEVDANKGIVKIIK